MVREFEALEEAFNEAVVSNNVERIGDCISTDWALVDAKAGIIPGERFLAVVREGILSHDTMKKEVLRVKVYENMAIVTGRGKNTGKFNGRPIAADEWITDIYRKEDGQWRCVLTHLTPVLK